MIAAAREKARGRELQTDFRVMDMLQMRGRFDPGFDMAFCIGNSLVHLQSDEQIYTLLADCRSLFKPGGRLILQIINYDRILAEGVTSLPALREESAGLEFVRNYELNPDRKSVIFHTELHVGRGTEHRVIENRIALRILTSEQLLALVRSAGFENPELFGGFDGRPFSLGSLPLILRAATS
jgi:SAM-dependent methyltransferase